MTRVYALFALFAALIAASSIVSRQREIAALRLLCAWGVASLVLWLSAAIFAFVGGALVRWDNPSAASTICAAMGAFVGAPLGIALSERGIWKSWPRWQALLFAALVLLLVIAAFLAILKVLYGQEQEAGAAVFVVFPLLGAGAVLGWLLGLRRRMVDPVP
jgi:hypothetical protein